MPHHMHHQRIAVSLLVAAASLSACSSDEVGTVAFTTWGEEYIESGIPTAEFTDGWTVSFDEFSIVLGNVVVADDESGEGARLAGTQLFDLTTPGPHAVGTTGEIEAGEWTRVSYEVVPASAATTVHASGDSTALDAMLAGGYSVYAAGTATKDQQSKTFQWGFTTHTSYLRCVELAGGQQLSGVVVTDGGQTRVELTIHGDHLFYDDLASHDAVLRFDHMAAADTNDDGEVTLDELAAVHLTDIPSGEGPYGTGSASNVNDLGAFITALTTTLGHYQGEGHCEAISQ